LNQKTIAIYYLTLSTIGAALILVVSRFSSSDTNTIHFFDRMVVGVVFISSCVLGISLAVRPNWIKRFTERESHDAKKQQPRTKLRGRQGHHPDCERFESHTIKMKDKVLCAGCTGLALGSIISIFLMGVYILLPNEIPPTVVDISIMSGMFLIALNYIETVIPIRNTLLHLFSNIFLVIGFFFVVMGIFQSAGSMIYGIFGVLTSFLWLDTRIRLSSWHHTRICKDCGETCKVY
jgi:Na+-driven multidrug efflux pump